MYTKLTNIFVTILPTIVWANSNIALHLQLSLILTALGEQLDSLQQTQLATKVVDTSISSEQIAQWLQQQIPHITLVLGEITDKFALVNGDNDL